MSQPMHVVRFDDRRTAYSFVAELRRLYDLNRFIGLQVHPAGNDVLVALPEDMQSEPELVDLATRHGGHLPASAEELEKLRAAVESARRTTDDSHQRMRQAHQAMTDASRAMERRGDVQARAVGMQARQDDERKHRL